MAVLAADPCASARALMGDQGSEAPGQLCGRLRKFIFEPGDNGFGVAVVEDEASGRIWTARGPLWGLLEGETVRLWGRVEDDPKWGRRFKVDSAQPALPTGPQALERWLRSGRVPGIGEVVAKRVVAAVGRGGVAAIRSDPTVLVGIAGLTGPKRRALVEAIAAIDAHQEAALYLHGLELGPALVQKILRRYGQDALRVVRNRPFSLAVDLVGVGFRTADRLARAAGMASDSPDRLRAAVAHVLQDLASQGHTAPPRAQVLAMVGDLAEVGVEQSAAAVDRGREAKDWYAVQADTADGAVVDALALPPLHQAEHAIAAWVASRSMVQGRIDTDDPRIGAAEQALGFALQGGQREAVARALRAPLLVVTGGPGTGKTTILRGVLAALGAEANVLLAAPTGRAARRMADASGREAKTLHRLLEYDPHQQKFTRDASRPLQAELVVVDEASMIDAPLAAALLAALPAPTRLLLVGDADQLPSVGPGAFLADLLASPHVDRVRLREVHRQSEASRIVTAAHQVLHGQVPQGSGRGEGGDFFVIPRQSTDEIAETLVEIVRDRLPRQGFDPIADVQVLAPVHRGPLGTQALSERLREALNPHGGATLRGLKVGDKLIQTKNDYDLDVFNGDIGTVVGLAHREPSAIAAATPALPFATEPLLRVRFGSREVQLGQAQLDSLELAYAVTVHKAQGSEYPAVVVPVHLGQHVMLQRNLLYTALTRAKRFAVLVGQPAAIARAVANAAPLARSTQLRRLLQQLGPQSAAAAAAEAAW
ncbi:MAG: ATP-dependent RecD-like DNA helicase [Deltaproteobacteria bacterium]|nr:ATP-dependent RecD-like DNA helicase [Deltaproteobacteria bacterium]